MICGIVGIISFTAIGTTTLAPVRRWSYRVFYITHVTLATALLPILFFHVSHIRIYLYETAVIYALNVLLRSWKSKTYFGVVKRVPNTDLVEVSVQAPDKEVLRRWQPGQHAYLSLAGHSLSRTFRSNPFSVASIPSIDGDLRFIARILDGNTKALASHANATDRRQKLTVEGPYGVQSHSDRLLQYDRVLLVAGGVGATFIVPLYRQLLADLSPSKGSYRRQKVSFLWAARDMADVTWAVPNDARDREGFVERMEVFLTGGGAATGAAVPTVGEGLAAGGDEEEEETKLAAYAETEEGIELEERRNLLSSDKANGSARQKNAVAMRTHAGRPDLKRLVDQTFSHGSTEKVAVLVCGPRGLSESLRMELGKWVGKGREVWLWEESFAL